mmetsp:Transcript_39111/g.124508  ORF Transcript_39111/g.124508 Transcript_39111/m.124508 type:complete len:202 (-) Transcript_39111:88-693(-)
MRCTRPGTKSIRPRGARTKAKSQPKGGRVIESIAPSMGAECMCSPPAAPSPACPPAAPRRAQLNPYRAATSRAPATTRTCTSTVRPLQPGRPCPCRAQRRRARQPGKDMLTSAPPPGRPVRGGPHSDGQGHLHPRRQHEGYLRLSLRSHRLQQRSRHDYHHRHRHRRRCRDPRRRPLLLLLLLRLPPLQETPREQGAAVNG